MLEETDCVPQVIKQGRPKVGGWVDGRYCPSFVPPALHPFSWCGKPDVRTNVVSGWCNYYISRPGDLSLSQLGCHFWADWIQVSPYISLVLDFFSCEVKAAYVTKCVSQPSPFSPITFYWTSCTGYLHNTMKVIKLSDVFLNSGCIFPSPFLFTPFPPTVCFQTGKTCSFIFFFLI